MAGCAGKLCAGAMLTVTVAEGCTNLPRLPVAGSGGDNPGFPPGMGESSRGPPEPSSVGDGRRRLDPGRRPCPRAGRVCPGSARERRDDKPDEKEST